MPRLAGVLQRLRRDAARLAQLDGRTALDLMRASCELALARVELLAADPEAWLAKRPGRRRPDELALIDRVAFAIPRMGARVPWRSSCLVQALAARRWLASKGVASELHLGARKPADGDMEAHAWLTAGGRTVVGGEPGDYQPFRPARQP